MGYYCNFKCDYCYFTQAGWMNIQKMQGEPKSPDEMESAWENICRSYGNAKIYITGGEPFLYPGFVNILTRIIKYHVVHVTTNLSLPVDEFIRKIPADKVEVNSTYHPLYMSIDEFVRQVIKLKSAGYRCGVCYLAYPAQLKEMINYKRYFKAQGIDMALTAYWGDYKDKEYPRDYNSSEKKYYRFAEDWNSESDEGFAERFIKIDKTDNRNSVESELSKGCTCYAGSRYATISVNGIAKPCGQINGPILGNLYDKTIKLLNGPYLCEAKFCKSKEYQYSNNTEK